MGQQHKLSVLDQIDSTEIELEGLEQLAQDLLKESFDFQSPTEGSTDRAQHGLPPRPPSLPLIELSVLEGDSDPLRDQCEEP